MFFSKNKSDSRSFTWTLGTSWHGIYFWSPQPVAFKSDGYKTNETFLKRVVFSILLDYDTMIKKLLSMSKSSKKKKRQKEKFKDSFITVDLVEKIFCNEETGKEWVPIEFDTSKIIKGLPSLPFQGKKKKLLKCPHISDSFLSIDLTFAGKLQKNF